MAQGEQGYYNSNDAYFHPMDPDILAKQNSTWIGGPTHSIQDQHIPFYTGHIHGNLSLTRSGERESVWKNLRKDDEHQFPEQRRKK